MAAYRPTIPHIPFPSIENHRISRWFQGLSPPVPFYYFLPRSIVLFFVRLLSFLPSFDFDFLPPASSFILRRPAVSVFSSTGPLLRIRRSRRYKQHWQGLGLGDCFTLVPVLHTSHHIFTHPVLKKKHNYGLLQQYSDTWVTLYAHV